MKVSVLMLAYNHAQYIAQAVDSVLMQQVDFDYEIVIGEDCSTDNTRDILLRYQQENPEKIRLLLPEKNLGMHDNLIQTFKACRGDYIALLEGDDYWTSPDKIQKQVDFLDARDDHTICFHKALVRERDGRPDWYIPVAFQPKQVFNLQYLLGVCNPMTTASIMFRQGFIHELPDWVYDLGFTDWVLQILLAQHGKIGYINETMSVYRIHLQGNWSQQNQIQGLLGKIKFFEHLSKHFDSSSKFQNNIRFSLTVLHRDLAIAYKKEGDRKNARRYMNIWFFKYLLANKILTNASYLKYSTLKIIQTHAPNLHKNLSIIFNKCKQLSIRFI